MLEVLQSSDVAEMAETFELVEVVYKNGETELMQSPCEIDAGAHQSENEWHGLTIFREIHGDVCYRSIDTIREIRAI